MSAQTGQTGAAQGFTRFLGVVDKGLSWFENWTLYLAVMVGMIALFINVLLRYTVNYTLAWSEELIREIIIYTTFIGCSAAIKNRSMVTIDAAVQLAPRLARPFAFISQLAVLIFSVMMTYYGYMLMEQKVLTSQSTIILEIPLWVLYMVLPLMGVMMFLRTIQVMWSDYQEVRQKRAQG